MFQTTIQISSGYYSNVLPISSVRAVRTGACICLGDFPRNMGRSVIYALGMVHGLVAKMEVPMNLEKWRYLFEVQKKGKSFPKQPPGAARPATVL